MLDIYGDDDTEYQSPQQEDAGDGPQPDEDFLENPPSPTSESGAPVKTSPSTSQETVHSLPPKPVPQPSSLSYSAQIAQQFSAYQQTPSQERQQRIEPHLPSHLKTGMSTATVTTQASPSGSMDCAFGKKPSEMHDTGYVNRFEIQRPKCFVVALHATTCRVIVSCLHPLYPTVHRHLLRYFAILLSRHILLLSIIRVLALETNRLAIPWQSFNRRHITHLPTISFTPNAVHLRSRHVANCSLVVSTGIQQTVYCPLQTYVVLCSANGHSLSSVHPPFEQKA